LRGVLDALDVLRLGLESVALFGDPTVGRNLFDRVVASDSGSERGWHSEERRLGLSMPGVPSRARIPSAWVGTSLCLLTPLAHRPHSAEGEVRNWLGPAQSALATLAAACGLERPGESGAAAGARLIREVFAGCCLVVDATWWSAVHVDGQYAAHPVAPEHCLATTDAASEEAAPCIDAWLAELLGLPHHSTFERPPATPRIKGRRRGFPRARLPNPNRSVGLAGERIEPLWASPAPRGTDVDRVSVLRVPGSFSSAWHNYKTHNP
jgi:hypothetical protein